MSPLDDLQARVRALAPEDYVPFRAWFLKEATGYYSGQRVDRVHPRPEDYETFDPEAYDDETEALKDFVHDRWVDDLRSLKSEAEVEAEDAQKARRGPGDYGVFLDLYTEEHPRPDPRAAPEEQAAWEWAHLDAYYERMERLDMLARHRIEKGAFIERKTRIHRDAQEHADAFLAPFKNRPPRAAEDDEDDREPWPPLDPEADLQRFWDVDDPEEHAEDLWLRATNAAYARADELWAGTYGWMLSLPLPRPEGWECPHRAVRAAASEMRSASEGSLRVGHLGRTLVRMRRALPLADEAVAAIDEAYDEPWLTPAAHRRLTELIGTAREALLDRYLDVRVRYAAFRDVAERVLGSAPSPAPGAAPEV